MSRLRHSVAALAEELVNRSDLLSEREAVVRAAVGRAYYAVFYLAKEVHATLKPPPCANQNQGAHGRLLDELHAAASTLDGGDKALLSSALGELRNLLHRRREADYNIKTPFAPMTALQSVDMARRVTRKLETVLQSRAANAA
jgi:hypothetical protein